MQKTRSKKEKGTVNQTKMLKHSYYRKMASLTIYLFQVSYFYFLPLTICLCSAFFSEKASTSFSFTHPITEFRLNLKKIPNAKAKKALPLHKRPSQNNSPFSYSSCRSLREAVHLNSVLCYTSFRQRNSSFLAAGSSGLYLCLQCCSFCQIFCSFGSQH